MIRMDQTWWPDNRRGSQRGLDSDGWKMLRMIYKRWGTRQVLEENRKLSLRGPWLLEGYRAKTLNAYNKDET